VLFRSTASSLYQKVGARDGIVVGRASSYGRVRLDPQIGFFSAALGSPCTCGGRPVTRARPHPRVPRPHFRRFVGHMLETLVTLRIGDRTRNDIIARVNLYAVKVMGTAARWGDE
jgi:truncated hemoglobin YjbI